MNRIKPRHYAENACGADAQANRVRFLLMVAASCRTDDRRRPNSNRNSTGSPENESHRSRLFNIRHSLALVLAVWQSVARADLFSSVQWSGREATSEALQGKSVLVLGFVTWCPICNGWSPQLLEQIKTASVGKPVIVLAIATDVDASRAKAYMQQRGFAAPNILYGSDPHVLRQIWVLDSKAAPA